MKSPLKAMLRLILILIIMQNNAHANAGLDISSLDLVYDRHNKKATFSGNVILCFDNVKLSSQKVIFMFQDENRRKIEKVHIPVKLKAIKQENGEETIIIADSGTYHLTTQTLRLKGNVLTQDKKDVIKTDEMIYHGKLNKIAKNEP